MTPNKAHQDDIHKSVSLAPSTSVKALQNDINESVSATSLLPSNDKYGVDTGLARGREEDPGCHLAGNSDFLLIFVTLVLTVKTQMEATLSVLASLLEARLLLL